jgi:hypothetical protein
MEEICIEHAIYFISKNFQGAEFNYTVTEKELLAVIYALNKFRHYITRYEIFCKQAYNLRKIGLLVVTHVRIWYHHS